MRTDYWQGTRPRLNVQQLPRSIRLLLLFLLVTALLNLPVVVSAQEGEEPAITYWGHLLHEQEAVTAVCSFEFSLWDSATGGTQLGTTQTSDNVAVETGSFTIALDVDDTAFSDDWRYLQPAVQCEHDTEIITLARQAVLLKTPSSSDDSSPTLVERPVAPPTDTGSSDTLYQLRGKLLVMVNYASDHSADESAIADDERTSADSTAAGDQDANPTMHIYGIVGGGLGNSAEGDYATVGGGRNNTASGPDATIAGGQNNTASANNATVGGGYGNVARKWNATISGGDKNKATESHATINGGYENIASANSAMIGGGHRNTASGNNAVVGGGRNNTASGLDSTIGGGQDNTASANNATVGGGYNNVASDWNATISGGDKNNATAPHSTISGGYQNNATGKYATVSGGDYNNASGMNTTIGGGYSNAASGYGATVAGGFYNTAASDYSFAVGLRATISPFHHGAMLLADSTDADFNSAATNEFAVRASGGVRLRTSSNLSTGCNLPTGSGSWSCTSDRDAKANVVPVDGTTVLERLAEVPINTWNYKGQDDTVRHIGPFSQDWYAAFGLGESDTTISTIDADGVALAAIQELHIQMQQKDAQIALQQQQIEDMQARINALEEQMGSANGIRQAPQQAISGALTALMLVLLVVSCVGVVLLVAVQRKRTNHNAG